MIFNHKIRSLDRFLPLLGKTKRVVCGIASPKDHIKILQEIGFTAGLQEGESILPSASYGSTCRKNAEGWVEIHKDQPMETYYTPVMWRWKQWRGRDSYEWVEEIRYRPGKRYPRTEHAPLGIELVIRLRTDGSKVLTTEFLPVDATTQMRIVNCINMLVEIFGNCELFTEDLDSIIKSEIRRLNWRVLPPGRLPWSKLEKEVKQILAAQPVGTQKVIHNRLETINQYEPDFLAIGQHGFAGYLIFGFSERELYLLESLYFGNATYLLGQDWEHLSRLSKGEILSNDLHQERVIHQKGWHKRIAQLLK